MEPDKLLLLPVERIIEINRAMNLVSENRYLRGDTGFKTARLGKRARPIAKAFDKFQEKLIRDNRLPEDKERDARYAREVADKVQSQIDSVLVRVEKILMPEFTQDEFIAQEDMRRVIEYAGDNGTRKNREELVRKGESLVTPEFLRIMHDFIKIGDKVEPTTEFDFTHWLKTDEEKENTKVSTEVENASELKEKSPESTE